MVRWVCPQEAVEGKSVEKLLAVSVAGPSGVTLA